MDIAIVIFELLVLLFSAVLHEIAHGYVAERLGDDTARRAGRLTLNPLVHLDPIGSVLMPALLLFATGGQFFFASAKPVPYNPNNLKNPRTGGAIIALAGPATNFILAIVFGIIIRIVTVVAMQPNNFAFNSLAQGIPFISYLAIIVYINIMLGIFNLVPIPPLDGSKLLYLILPQNQTTFRIMYFLERWGIILVLAFVFFGFELIVPLIQLLFTLLTGQSFGM